MRIIDLFSGCGGMSLGFQLAGYDVLTAVDNWMPAVEVYRQNFDHPICQVDLGDVEAAATFLKKYDFDMIIGGPPCQDFSSAGKRDESLGRADLTISFAQLVVALRPKWFVMENVQRILKSHTLKEARRTFRQGNYGLSAVVLDASYCGVPQARKRFFLVGELGGYHNSLTPYLEKNQSEVPMNIYDYLGNRLGIEHYYRHPRNYNRRGIYSIYEPSPTVRGVNRPLPKGYKGHPADSAPVSQDIRPLTTIERSYIQTFPEEFVFSGNKSDMEQMIGNAVPVNLAKYVAECIREYVEDKCAGGQLLPNQGVQLGFFERK